MFFQVINDAYSESSPTDMIGIRFIHSALRRGYYDSPFRARTEMTPERIFATLEKLMQSENELNVDDELEIVFTRIPQMRGGRPTEKKWNHRAWMQKHCGPHGGCFIQIKNPEDELCLPRALVVAKARIDKETNPEIERQWKTIRKGDADRRTLQKRMAQALMVQAGLEDHTGKKLTVTFCLVCAF